MRCMAWSSKKRARQDWHLKCRSLLIRRPSARRQSSMVRVISTAPHSGHGSGSDVGTSLRGDEDIEDVDPFFRENLAEGPSAPGPRLRIAPREAHLDAPGTLHHVMERVIARTASRRDDPEGVECLGRLIGLAAKRDRTRARNRQLRCRSPRSSLASAGVAISLP